jgi:threonine dehydratase
MDIAGEVIAAEKTIRPYIRKTYLEYSPFYSRMTGAQVYFKLENLQHTGSFKLRGAMNKLLSLTDEEKRRGVVTASTGNHGAAFAYGLSKDDYITVTEEEIKDSLREFIQTQHMLIEGSAAVAVAAFKKQADRFAGKNVVVIICGGNISIETLKSIL